MPDKQNSITSNNPDAQGSGHGKLVQLVFVKPMNYLKKTPSIVAFYFTRQHCLKGCP